ncbi:hypothetical protein HK102_002940, partial [Quaeritorhiza haematococci]
MSMMDLDNQMEVELVTFPSPPASPDACMEEHQDLNTPTTTTPTQTSSSPFPSSQARPLPRTNTAARRSSKFFTSPPSFFTSPQSFFSSAFSSNRSQQPTPPPPPSPAASPAPAPAPAPRERYQPQTQHGSQLRSQPPQPVRRRPWSHHQTSPTLPYANSSATAGSSSSSSQPSHSGVQILAIPGVDCYAVHGDRKHLLVSSGELSIIRMPAPPNTFTNSNTDSNKATTEQEQRALNRYSMRGPWPAGAYLDEPASMTYMFVANRVAVPLVPTMQPECLDEEE